MFVKKRTPVHQRKTPSDAPADAEAPILLPQAKKVKVAGQHLQQTTKNDETRPIESGEVSAPQTDAKGSSKVAVELETETERGRDSRSILERNEEIGKKILAGELESGVYRGAGAYAPILNRREGAIAASKYTGLFGPVRGSLHARTTMRIDYQPDVCKDYKETGYCGFGDTCKFLHDRSDYKSGAQLDKEWNEQQRAKEKKLQARLQKKLQAATNEDEASASDSDSGDSSDDEGKLPFACHICRKKWSHKSNPVVTQCRHYFCEKCAFERYGKSAKCAVCSKATLGVFNTAQRILDKLKERGGDDE